MPSWQNQVMRVFQRGFRASNRRGKLVVAQERRNAAKAEAAGVPVALEIWAGMQHGWHITAGFVPEGRRALERAGEFLARD